jgi:hypothetical protein
MLEDETETFGVMLRTDCAQRPRLEELEKTPNAVVCLQLVAPNGEVGCQSATQRGGGGVASLRVSRV